MPVKPASPCSHPGCPELTHERYCDAHAKAEDAVSTGSEDQPPLRLTVAQDPRHLRRRPPALRRLPRGWAIHAGARSPPRSPA